MKIKDVLNEGVTDIVARFYIEASKDCDRFYNPENVKYKEKNAKHYKEHFDSWFNEGIVPVFTKPTTKPQPKFDNDPKPGKLQTPGYRGLQYALAAAGLPYNHNVQEYTADPSRIIASQTMDGARNNNSN